MISSGPSKTGNVSFILFQFFYLASILWLPIYFGAVHLWSLSFGVFFLSFFFGVYFLSILFSKKPVVIRSGLFLWITAYFLVYVLSGVKSSVPSRTLTDALKPASAALAFFSTLYYCRHRKDVERLCLAMALLGGGLSVFGLLQFLGALPKDWWAYKNFLSATYVNHNHFAGLLELLLPVSLGFSLCQDDKAKKSLVLFMCVLMGAAFALTLSRGGYGAILTGLFFWVLLLSKRGAGKKSWWVFFSFVFLVGAVVMVFGWEPIVNRLGTLKSNALETDPYHRWFIWKGTLDLIAHFPWWGTGPGTFEFAFLKFRPAGFQYWRPVYAHNDYLNLLADCGVFVFAATVCLFGSVVRKAVCVIRREESRLKTGVAAGVLAGFVSLAVHSFTDFNFHIPANFIYASVMAGMLFSLEETRYYGSLFFDRLSRLLLLALAVFVLAAGFLLGFSDYFLWKGKAAMKKVDYKTARGYFDRSLFFNPGNDEVYFDRALIRARMKEPLGAVYDFDRAILLNPFEPYYDFEKANTIAGLQNFNLKEVSRVYESAISKDPNDADLVYSSGQGLLMANSSRNPFLETRALGMLRKAVSLDEGHLKHLYPLLWKRYKSLEPLEAFVSLTPDRLKVFSGFLESEALWKYHRKYYLESLGIDPWESAQTGRGLSWKTRDSFILDDFKVKGGGTVYSGSVFFCNGEVQRKINISGNIARILIHAKGSSAAKVYPYLVITLDDKVIDSMYLNTGYFADFYSVLKTNPSEHTLGIRYANDFVETKGLKRDRNVWIDKVEIQYPR